MQNLSGRTRARLPNDRRESWMPAMPKSSGRRMADFYLDRAHCLRRRKASRVASRRSARTLQEGQEHQSDSG